MAKDEGPEEKWVIVADDTLGELTQEERDKYLTPGLLASFSAMLDSGDEGDDPEHRAED
ncbi:MAG: hypothetical protein SOI26_03805 [Coriobacteriales bacterium]|jgi:hypothetical protein